MQEAKPAGWLGGGARWIVASAGGYAAGNGVWQALFPLLRPGLANLAGGEIGIITFGAVLGVTVGLAQALASPWARMRAGVWTLASGVGFAVGLVVATWVSGELALLLSGRVIVAVSDGSEDLAFGLLLGGSVGLARWIVDRRTPQDRAPHWIWAGAVAVAVGWPATLGMFDILPGFEQPWLGVAFGACAGLLIGLVEVLCCAMP